MAGHMVTRTESLHLRDGIRLDCTCGWTAVVVEGAARADAITADHMRRAHARDAAEQDLAAQVDGHQRIELSE